MSTEAGKAIEAMLADPAIPEARKNMVRHAASSNTISFRIDKRQGQVGPIAGEARDEAVKVLAEFIEARLRWAEVASNRPAQQLDIEVRVDAR